MRQHGVDHQILLAVLVIAALLFTAVGYITESPYTPPPSEACGDRRSIVCVVYLEHFTGVRWCVHWSKMVSVECT